MEYIKQHIMDILAGDAQLIAGGTSYNPRPGSNAWLGYKQPSRDVDVATPGYVNLFDEVYAEDTTQARPAIYVGMKGYESSDHLEFVTASGPTPVIQYRKVMIPLIVIVTADTRWHARKQRAQLRANVLQILNRHQIESGYWYLATVEGTSGSGPDIERDWASSTGGGAQAIAEAGCSIPISVRYVFNAQTLA